MLKRRCHEYTLFFRTRGVTTAALPLDPPSLSVSSTSNYHRIHCLSLIDRLVQKGRFSSAQYVIQRIISVSPSVSDAYVALDYASKRGMELDVNRCVNLIGKLVNRGQMAFNYNDFCSGGMSTNIVLLNTTKVACFCLLGKIEEARSHFCRVIELGSSPCEAACYLFLRELLAKGMVLEAFNYFSHKANIPATLHQLKLGFYGLCQRGYLTQAVLLCSVMESRGFYVDKVMYTSLICRYFKERNMKMATRVFFRMLKMGCEPDTFTYNTMIYGFWKLRLSRGYHWMYYKMIDSGNEPNAVTNHIMISSLCREGKLVDAKDVFFGNDIVLPLVHSYTALISLLYKQNKLIDFDQLLNTMLERRISPDHLFYFAASRKYQVEDKLRLAVDMLVRIRIFENQSHCIPNYPGDMKSLDLLVLLLDEIATKLPHLATIAFSISICACCEIGDLPAATSLIDIMEANGFQPLIFTYNCLIKCYCDNGRFEDAESIFCFIQGKGLTPGVETFLILVHGYCKEGRFEKAKDAFNQMVEMGLKPNVAIYDTLINFLGKRKRVSEAEDLFNRMLDEGNDPDEAIFMKMITAYMKSGRVDESIELFEKMKNKYPIQPTLYSYTPLISGLVKKNRIEKVCAYLEEMIQDGVGINNVFCTSLIKQLLIKRAFGAAFRIVDLMKRSEIDDAVTYIVLNSGVIRHAKVDKLGSVSVDPRFAAESRMLVSSLERRGYVSLRDSYLPEALNLKLMSYQAEADKFNLHLCNIRISLHCKAKEMDEANNRIETMEKEGPYPNQVTYTILMSWYINHGDIRRAVGVFKRMNANGCLPDQVSYDTLLKGFCLSGMLLHALSITYLLHKKGRYPSKSSYKILLRQLCECNMTDYAFKIFEESIFHGYRTDRYSCRYLYENLCRDGMMDEAKVVSDYLLDFKDARVNKVRLNQHFLLRYNLVPQILRS